jgi:hypothetical protein
VTASISDGNFEAYQDISFIPTKCHWFEVENSNSYESYEVLNQMPGEREITFRLNLINNPFLQCNELFNFYSQFDHDAFRIKFIIDSEKD